jgi:cytochrome c oxidase subunit 2
MKDQGKHLVSATFLWVVLTAFGEVLAVTDLYPTVGSEQAQEFDDIFRYLMILGVPVWTFVLAVLFYSFLRFKANGPMDDAPTMRGHGWVPKAWIAVTSALTLSIMIYPGLIGLADVRRSDNNYAWGEELADNALVIDVTAFRWAWRMEYEESGVVRNGSAGEDVVLPLERQVRFRIQAQDVLHSFWIPAFRTKIDIVPGRTMEITVTPNRLGNYDDDAAYRLQCAELCGINHADMRMHVRVVEEAEFEAWLKEHASTQVQQPQSQGQTQGQAQVRQ